MGEAETDLKASYVPFGFIVFQLDLLTIQNDIQEMNAIRSAKEMTVADMISLAQLQIGACAVYLTECS